MASGVVTGEMQEQVDANAPADSSGARRRQTTCFNNINQPTTQRHAIEQQYAGRQANKRDMQHRVTLVKTEASMRSWTNQTTKPKMNASVLELGSEELNKHAA